MLGWRLRHGPKLDLCEWHGLNLEPEWAEAEMGTWPIH
jgi:hypothetical protein